MARRIICLLVLVIYCVTACTTSPTPVPTASAAQISLEEQAVYSAVLLKLYAAESYVIMDTTATGPGGVEDTGATLKRVEQNLRGIQQDTMDSFKTRNETAQPFPSNLDLGSQYTLLSQTQKSQIFSPNRDGWQAFYEQYPQAPGITALSWVGFNATFDQALVYVSTLSQRLAGAGYYVLLKKNNGTWIVDQQVMTWIS